MRKRPYVQMLVMGAIGVAIILPIVLSIHWFPSQGSAQAHRVDTLYKVLLICSVPIFVLVETVVIYSVWKFRMRAGEELKDGPPVHGNTRLEVMWTAAPAVLILALCIYAYSVLRSDERTQPGTMTVNVIGEQFAWFFSYPQSGGQAVVSPQLYLPKGVPVVFRITSRDVIHAFWVPAFREQLDAVPGLVDTLRVTPTRLGSYPLVCAELCGNGHSLMRAPVHVVMPASFRTWLAAQPRTAAPAGSFGATAAAGSGTPSSSSTPAGGGAATGSQGSPAGGKSPGKAAGSSSAAGNSTGASTSGASTGSSPKSSASAPALTGGNAAAGKAVFTGLGGCGACHTLADAGTSGQIGPNLSSKIVADAKRRGLPLAAFIRESIVKPNAYISPGYPADVMPQNFGQTLSASQLNSLVTYLASVTK